MVTYKVQTTKGIIQKSIKHINILKFLGTLGTIKNVMILIK